MGKPQLRIDETRKLEAVAMQRAQNGDVPSSGVLLMLYLDSGRERLPLALLETSTMMVACCGFRRREDRNAKRRLKIPEQIRPLVLARIEGQEPDEPIFYPLGITKPTRGYYVAQLRGSVGWQMFRWCVRTAYEERTRHSR